VPNILHAKSLKHFAQLN